MFRATANHPGNIEGLSNYRVNLWRTLGGALAKLWPQDCFVCGRRAGDKAICAACERELPVHAEACCPICALPTPQGQQCGRCLHQSPHFDATLAAYAYDHPVREMLLALKFGAAFAVRDVLLDGVLAVINKRPDLKIDCVVPMPLHRKRIAERGFNQTVLLAHEVGKVLAAPVRCDLVVRDVDTAHQARMPIKQRRKNMRGAFRCVESFDGQHVLVIDDVMTSGATLDELARTLKLAGAARVTNLLVARTLRSK